MSLKYKPYNYYEARNMNRSGSVVGGYLVLLLLAAVIASPLLAIAAFVVFSVLFYAISFTIYFTRIRRNHRRNKEFYDRLYRYDVEMYKKIIVLKDQSIVKLLENYGK
jgi:beta-lactamase regulating signal transducer with metallopeptidase domain